MPQRVTGIRQRGEGDGMCPGPIEEHEARNATAPRALIVLDHTHW